MKEKIIVILVVLSLVTFIVIKTADNAAAQQSISASLGIAAFPSKGQSKDQQNKDEGDCYAWAKQQTGIDPAAVANAPSPASGSTVGGGERARGAARGAIGGAAVGAIAGDAGKGAAIGAAAGTVSGGRKARQNKRAQQEQAEASKGAALQQFNKAFSACMEGKGYSVK